MLLCYALSGQRMKDDAMVLSFALSWQKLAMKGLYNIAQGIALCLWLMDLYLGRCPMLLCYALSGLVCFCSKRAL